MTNEDLSKELWKTANIFTGFAVFQTIAFTYACAKPDFSEIINTPITKATIAMIIVIVSAIECYSVWWCTKQQMSLLIEVNHPKETEDINFHRAGKIIERLGWGRIICIVFLLVPFFVSLYAPQLNGRPFRNQIIPNNSIQTDARPSHR